MLQSTVLNLETQLAKAKTQSKVKQREQVGKSPRTIRRIKENALKRVNEVTGREYVLMPKQSPRKTTVLLDQAGVSLRKYSRLKGPQRPSVRRVTKARNTLNENATNVGMLLRSLVAKCHCDGPARVKVSVDGHNPTKNSSAVTFSLSLVCETGAQSSKHVVPVLDVPGAESYELVRDAKEWQTIEAELHPVVDVGDRTVNVEYYLCADLKSILLHLGYKAANARDVCVYCTCAKNRWGMCCSDGKCANRHLQASDGIFLPKLSPGDPEYKRPPLANLARYRFVMIDLLHLYLRITDQLFVRSCNLMCKRQLDEFIGVCRHHNVQSFNLRDENGTLKFSNLDRMKRDKLLSAIFLDRKVLHTLMPSSRVDLVVSAVERFLELWKQLDSDAPYPDELQVSVEIFTRQFRKSFASDEVPNYVHLLCHVPMLVRYFGSLKPFQQQRVEALNHTLNVKVRSMTRPGPSQMTEAVQAVNRSLWYK